MWPRRPTPPTSASSSTTPSGPVPRSPSAWSSGWPRFPTSSASNGRRHAPTRWSSRMSSPFQGPPLHHRQSSAVRHQPHAGRARLRGASVQLLAGMGHQADRRPEPAAIAVQPRSCARPCPSTNCGSRSRRPTRAATAISTSSAWNWWASIPAAAGRRPVTYGVYRERTRQMLVETGVPRVRRCDAMARRRESFLQGKLEIRGGSHNKDDQRRTQSRQDSRSGSPVAASALGAGAAFASAMPLASSLAADKVTLRTNWLFYGSHGSSSSASTRASTTRRGSTSS